MASEKAATPHGGIVHEYMHDHGGVYAGLTAPEIEEIYGEQTSTLLLHNLTEPSVTFTAIRTAAKSVGQFQ
jgi:hypothetical protein